MPNKIIGIIPARYGSTRLKGKLLIPILGKTLIQRTYENAKQSQILDKLIVATDDQRIFDHVKEFGGEVVMTSDCWINGTERIAEVLQQNPDWLNAEAIVNIQGDEPCLDFHVIEKAVHLLLQDASASMATVATPIRDSEEANQPSCVKCVLDQKQNALYFSRALIPGNHSLKFNATHPFYRHIGLYIYRPSFLLEYCKIPSTPLQIEENLEQLKVLEMGYRIKVAITEYCSMGVDVPEDLIKIEQWLAK